MLSIKKSHRTLPFFMLLGLVAIATTSVILYLPSLSNTEVHQTGHSLLRESEAVHFPLEITQVYKEFETEGDTDSGEEHLKIYENVIDTQRHCEFCIAFVYTPGQLGKAEVAFSSTVKGYDLSEAKKVSFYIMGDKGDEVVTLKAGGKKTLPNVIDKKSKEFAVTTKPIKLEKQWQKLEIDLKNKDLKDVTYPFGIEFTDNKNGQPVVMFVKWIKYESAEPTNPLQNETVLPDNAGGPQ
jgi:hypothetical protein